MLIKTVQVACNFFTILLTLYNSALLPTQPKLYTGKYAIRLTCPAHDSEKKWIWIPAKSNQHKFSPNDNNTQSRENIPRINEVITKGKMLWPFYQILSTYPLRKWMEISLRICQGILGIRELMREILTVSGLPYNALKWNWWCWIPHDASITWFKAHAVMGSL